MTTYEPYHSDNVTASDGPTTTTGKGPPPMATWHMVLVVLVCSIIIVCTVIGNLLVFISVGIVRKLRTPSNLLIVSLAVSDFLVGLLVMPLALFYEVKKIWVLGPKVCDAWTSLDVLLCTSSILNLCVISLDRYLVITRPFRYAIKRTPKRMALMIMCVWALSAVISIPPLFGWKETLEDKTCHVSQSVGYQIYATLLSFYIPLTVMIFVYFRIYRVSHKIAREEAKSQPQREGHLGYLSGATTPLRRDSEEPNAPPVTNGGVAKKSDASGNSTDIIPKISIERAASTTDEHLNKGRLRFLKKYKLKGKESKAVKTLGVIMGAFSACWLPFFILAVVKAAIFPRTVPAHLDSFLLWLGYANSFLNPIIYARFNRDFRTPFKEILLFRCCDINDRMRHELYSEKFGGMSVRNSLRPPQHSVVKYQSQGQTVVELGNGDVRVTNDAAKL